MRFPYVVRRAAELCPEVGPERLAQRIAAASYVNLERRYLYFEIAKAGCTSMKWLLHEIEGASPVKYAFGQQRQTRRDMFIHVRSNLPIPSLLDLDEATQEQVLSSPDFMRFTVVRNPYARVESAWRDKVYLCAPSFEGFTEHVKGRLPESGDPDSQVSFGEFVDVLRRKDLANANTHWRLQAVQVMRGALNLTHVGRVEDFSAIMRAFRAHVGLPPGADRRAKNKLPGTSRYDQALADRVHELYREDFETFGYGRDSWVPAPEQAARTVPESAFLEEVLERNRMLILLYDERDRLAGRVRELEQAQTRNPEPASPLHLGPASSAVDLTPAELESALRSETDPFLRAHYTFRLAERHRLAGALDQALAAYLARTSLGHWDLEVAWSFYRAAQLKEGMGHPVEEVLDAYARAHAVRPDRAEPLHGASRLCRVAGRFAEGFDFARSGLAIAMPNRAPFVETWIYDYGLLDEWSLCAYYTGRHAEAFQACEALLRGGKLPAHMRDRVATNSRYARAQLDIAGNA